MTRVVIHQSALDRLIRQNPRFLAATGRAVRDQARRNASGLGLAGQRASRPEQAIVSVPGADTEGPYVDVGYDKRHPGFYLWWYEVGSRYAAPMPHLRPALRPGLLD